MVLAVAAGFQANRACVLFISGGENNPELNENKQTRKQDVVQPGSANSKLVVFLS